MTDKLHEIHGTDSGNAELIVALHGDRLRYDYRRGRWLLFQPGLWWQGNLNGQIERIAAKIPRERIRLAASIEDQGARGKAVTWGLKSESKTRRDAMLELAKSELPIADDGEGWDAEPMLLAVRNGVVDLRTGRLREGKPDDKLTKHLELSFDADAKCSRWTRFLGEIFGDDADVVDYVHRACGYSLTGDTSEQCLFIAHGDGANGKSVFLSTLRHTLGPFAVNAPFSTFEFSGRQAIPADVAALDGARFITASESNEGTQLNEARIKMLTGDDSVTARFLHGQFFTFTPTGKIWLCTNHKPKVSDDSLAFWRRVRLIPFERTFQGEDADAQLPKKLEGEAAGILAWAVRGCLAWQKQRLEPPAAVVKATEEYEREADVLAEFLDECCFVGPDATARAGDVYRAYLRWADSCGLSGRNKLSQTALGIDKGF